MAMIEPIKFMPVENKIKERKTKQQNRRPRQQKLIKARENGQLISCYCILGIAPIFLTTGSVGVPRGCFHAWWAGGRS